MIVINAAYDALFLVFSLVVMLRSLQSGCSDGSLSDWGLKGEFNANA